jgi:spore coat polysaccharide biosynthesis predicted glycosyltransferase SpsG
MKKIIHIAAGSRKYGFGHIGRSRELLKDLRLFFDVSFYVYIEEECPAGLDIKDNIRIQEPFTKEIADLVLIDMPEVYAQKALEYYAFQMHSVPLAALGCYINVKGKPNVVINLDDMGHDFSWQPNCFIGLEYGIIREIFFQYRKIQKDRKNYRNIALSLGGADVGNLSESLIRLLDKKMRDYKNIQYHLILGPLSERKEFKTDFLNLNVYYGPKNIEQLMSEADIAICNGGTTMMEYAFLGIPAIAIPQTLHEEIFVRKFESKGAAVLIKKEEIGKDLCGSLYDLIGSDSKREFMQTAGRKMIDGMGRGRIVEILKEFV